MPTLQLRAPVITTNKWCGPAAISAITGVDSGVAAATIRRFSGRNAIMRTSSTECRQALRLLGYASKPVLIDGSRPTLAGWLRRSKAERTAGRVFLILAGRHWQVISGRRYTCGIVKEIVSIRHPRVKRRARVAGVYEIIKMPFAYPGLTN